LIRHGFDALKIDHVAVTISMAVLWVSGLIEVHLSIGIVLFLLLLRSLNVSLTAIDHVPE